MSKSKITAEIVKSDLSLDILTDQQKSFYLTWGIDFAKTNIPEPTHFEIFNGVKIIHEKGKETRVRVDTGDVRYDNNGDYSSSYTKDISKIVECVKIAIAHSEGINCKVETPMDRNIKLKKCK